MWSAAARWHKVFISVKHKITLSWFFLGVYYGIVWLSHNYSGEDERRNFVYLLCVSAYIFFFKIVIIECGSYLRWSTFYTKRFWRWEANITWFYRMSRYDTIGRKSFIIFSSFLMFCPLVLLLRWRTQNHCSKWLIFPFDWAENTARKE